MWKTLIFYSVISCLVDMYSTNYYCDTKYQTKYAFNIGNNVFIDDNWMFDSNNRIIFDQQFDIKEMFGNTFESINTGFSFYFPECKSNTNTTQFCKTVRKAMNLLIVIGVIDDEYGYVSYRYSKQNPKELIQTTNDDMPWGLPSSGDLKGDFWAPNKHKVYNSIVFVPKRNELYASLKQDNSHLYTRKLDGNGVFSTKWKVVMGSTLHGLFYIDLRVFSVNVNDMVFELKWTYNIPEYYRKTNTKEFFNCYGNSTLGPPIIKDLTNDSKLTKIVNEITTQTLIVTEAAIIDKSKPKNESKTSLYIAIIVVAILFLLLIIAIIFVVIAWRKKSKSKKSLPKRLIIKKAKR